MSTYKRILSIILGLSASGAAAQSDHSEPEGIKAALQANYLRVASKNEIAKALAGMGYPGDFPSTTLPVYVLRDARAIQMIGDLRSEDQRFFIVPASVKQRTFGESPSVFMTPAGDCLQGPCGNCAPTASPTYQSDYPFCYPPRGEPVLAPPAPPRY